MVFDAIAIRVNGPKAWDERLSIGIELTDLDRSWRLDLHHGVLIHRESTVEGADVVLRLPAAGLTSLLAGKLDGISIEGDQSVIGRLMAVLDEPDPEFAIVTP